MWATLRGFLILAMKSTSPQELVPRGEVETGWSASGDQKLRGQDIAIGGAVSEVKVDVGAVRRDLGSAPATGQTFPLPLGLEGAPVVDGYDDGEQQLQVRLNVRLGGQREPPAGLTTCAVSKPVALGPGTRCDFWLGTGAALGSVEWSFAEVNGIKPIVLNLRSSVTTYVARAAGR